MISMCIGCREEAEVYRRLVLLDGDGNVIDSLEICRECWPAAGWGACPALMGEDDVVIDHAGPARAED